MLNFCEIINHEQVHGNLWHLALAAGFNQASYFSPGQYVEIKTDTKNLYLVIASQVGDDKWHFYYRADNSQKNWLSQKKIGEKLELSQALGEGCNIEQLMQKNIIFCTSGTGLAGVYPLLAAIKEERDSFGLIKFYHTIRYEKDFFFANLIKPMFVNVPEVKMQIYLTGEKKRRLF